MKKYYVIVISIAMMFTYRSMAQPPVPANPVTGNPSNCTILGPGNTPIDMCPVGSNVFVTSFTGGVYNRGNNGNHLGPGAIWRFNNIGLVGSTVINVEVTVNSQYQAEITNMDNNAALDQAGVSVADFFAPRIRPDVSLNNSDRRGYVEMTMNFFQGVNNFTTPIVINTLNMISYDADGSYETGGSISQAWFRETRVAEVYNAANPSILASNNTELVAYNYADAGKTWNGFAGGVYERDGLSRCAEVASSFRYSAAGRSSVTFRFGYDFKAGTNGYNIGRPDREYGMKFGCYSFPSQITLPVSLISFSATLKNNTTVLSWETENEINFNHYEVERKAAQAADYSIIANKSAQGAVSRSSYQFTDNLASLTDDVFYYRLKMVDVDGKFKYSNVIMVRKNQKIINGISINPNPVSANETTTVRFQSSSSTVVTLRVVDMTGRMVLQQLSKVTEGINSVPVNKLGLLKPGIYVMQLADGEEISAIKFSIVR